MYNLSLFIFRRDLRLIDNTALNEAIKRSKKVLCAFIFTNEQIVNNKYKSSNAIQFMIESLFDLEKEIAKKGGTLIIMFGDNIESIIKIKKKYDFEAIFFNRDYTPYARKRDKEISLNFENVFSFDDYLLSDCLKLRAKNGNIYLNFSHFFKKAKQNSNYEITSNVAKGKIVKAKKKEIIYDVDKINKEFLEGKYYQYNDKIAMFGGRKNALKQMNKIGKTSKMSCYNKFGCISIRELHKRFVDVGRKDLIRQLFWRDYYYYIAFNDKDIFQYKFLSAKKNKNINWNTKTKNLRKWKEGLTGFPIVDAGMRELNETGFIDNRIRLIVSNFLVKELLINWKYGEQYFSQKLIDIDRSQNIGNWNWASSFGLDRAPFLRILNPWTQSANYDKKGTYIKKWIPDLQNVKVEHLHKWNKYNNEYNVNYPKPIVDHNVQRIRFARFHAKIN